MTKDSTKVALLIIDPQIIYFNKNSEMYCADVKQVISNINLLIKCFTNRKFPIFFIKHIHKSDGSDQGRMFDFSGCLSNEFNFKEGSKEVEYIPTLDLPKNYIEIIKNRYSAFDNTTLNNQINSLQIKRLAIVGFMTNFCCESTARAAHDKDYFVDFIIDATSAPNSKDFSCKEIKEYTTNTLNQGFSCVVETNDYIKKLIL